MAQPGICFCYYWEFTRHSTFLVVSGSAQTYHLSDRIETDKQFVICIFEQLTYEESRGWKEGFVCTKQVGQEIKDRQRETDEKKSLTFSKGDADIGE